MDEDVSNNSPDNRRVADYFVIAGLPKDRDKLQLLDEYSLEVNLKPSAYQDPITDVTVIFPGLGENVPDYYQMIDATPWGLSANLNHGSFRAPEVYLCFRRDRSRPPLVDLGVLYDGRDKVMPDSQIVEFTKGGHSANVSNSASQPTFLTYRRATEMSPCNELVVMDICVIVASKGETPPHSFMKIDKSLNKGMVSAEVFICYKKSMNRADLISYKPSLLSRFPVHNLPSYSLEETVALFCLPMGATLECWPANSARSSAINSTFVLTLANRSKVYGSAITFYEEVDENTLTDEQRTSLQVTKYKHRKILTNKCICLLSRWPFFEAFEKFLFFLHKRQLMGPFDVPLEKFVAHFLYDVPFPSPSRPRILLQLDAIERIALSQPEELPLPRSGACFRNLLTNLGPDNCILLLLLALTEQKILLHSLRPSVLTSVAEAAMQIIFPFYWQCPFIPLCPIGMSDYLAAPLPFVIGLDSRFFDLYDQPSDVNAVDLDTSTVTLCLEKRGLSSKLLPKKASRQLKTTLTALLEKCWTHDKLTVQAHLDDGAIDFDFTLKKRETQLELEIREAFLRFNVSILSGYRHFLLPITKAPTVGATDVDNLFDQSGFLRSRDRNFHKFYHMMMKTQMFTKFIEERSFVSETNTCLAFFDECVDRIEDSPRFLEVEGFESDRTVFILPPEADPSEDPVEFRQEQFVLDPRLFPDPPEQSVPDNAALDEFNVMSTPASSLARRTKQEIRSAQKLARRHQKTPYLWAKCLINTCYSLWFIHLPGFVTANQETHRRPQTLRIGLTLLQRMKRLRLHPADEICYRVMMQLCGVYSHPVLAVKVLFEMKNIGLQPNAVTYGYYNKAVLESQWPSSEDSAMNRPQTLWHHLRMVLLAISIFKRVVREGDFLSSRYKSLSTNALAASNNNSNNNKNNKDEMDSVSQASSEDSAVAAPTNVNNSPPVTSNVVEKEEENVLEEVEVAEENEEEVKDDDEGGGVEDDGVKGGLQFRKRLTSIVKPQGGSLLEEGGESVSEVPESTENKNPSAPNSKSDSSITDSGTATTTKTTTLPPPPPFSPKTHLPKGQEIIFEHQEDDLGVSSLQDLKLDTLGQDMKMLKTKTIVEEEDEEGQKVNKKANGNVVGTRYSEIRGKHMGLFNKSVDSDNNSADNNPENNNENKKNKVSSVETPTIGDNKTRKVSRSLFQPEDKNEEERNKTNNILRSESTDSANLEQKVRDYMEPPQSRSKSVSPEEEEEEDNTRRKRNNNFRVVESPSSDGNNSTASSSLNKIASGTSLKSQALVGTPVTENDPLGALSSPELEVQRRQVASKEQQHNRMMTKSATLPTVEGSSSSGLTGAEQLQRRTVGGYRPDDNILGSPFSDDKLNRSATLDSTTTTTSPLPSSTFASSFRSLTKSAGGFAVTSKLSSLKKISSSYTAYLSPNAAAKEALAQGIKSAYSVVSKRVEEIRESVGQQQGQDYYNTPISSPGMTPAHSSQYLATPNLRDDDALSTASNESRRPSTTTDPAFLYANDQSDTWSSFTGNLWEQFWGGGGGHNNNPPPINTIPRASDITEKFEGLYGNLPRRLPGPEAMQIQMTSCSRCLKCSGILFDEEIMSGWTAEDSNLNTRCPFCTVMVVPFLTIRVVDFRTVLIATKEGENINKEEEEPKVSDHITVPYISPLVLRKELENMLLADGDQCLLDPQCVDSHPIIFWNLIWFFERIAVKSHLPGLCLGAKSLDLGSVKEGPWDHRNVNVKCRWDNERLHESGDRPLYTMWQQDELVVQMTQGGNGEDRVLVVGPEGSNKRMVHGAFKGVMQHIIAGAAQNDLLQPIKTLLERRNSMRLSASPNKLPTSPTTSTTTTMESPSSSSVKTPRSIYREIMYLTLVSLGQENIDLTAFDREYRRAFEKLPAKYDHLVHMCDKPPNMQTVFCRKLFRELRL